MREIWTFYLLFNNKEVSKSICPHVNETDIQIYHFKALMLLWNPEGFILIPQKSVRVVLLQTFLWARGHLTWTGHQTRNDREPSFSRNGQIRYLMRYTSAVVFPIFSKKTLLSVRGWGGGREGTPFSRHGETFNSHEVLRVMRHTNTCANGSKEQKLRSAVSEAKSMSMQRGRKK